MTKAKLASGDLKASCKERRDFEKKNQHFSLRNKEGSKLLVNGGFFLIVFSHFTNHFLTEEGSREVEFCGLVRARSATV